MFNRFKNIFRARTKPITAMEALDHIQKAVERMNIPKPGDDVDVGYDMAIDEVIDLISDYRKLLSTPVVQGT